MFCTMVNSCAAFNCTNRATRGTNLSFHKFPLRDLNKLREWLVKIRRDNFTPSKHTVICSQHFEKDCFWKNGNKKILKPSAIPTIFCFTDNMSKKIVARPSPEERNVPVLAENVCKEVRKQEYYVQHDHTYDVDKSVKYVKYEAVINRKKHCLTKYKKRYEKEVAKSKIKCKKIESMSLLMQEFD